MRIDSIRTSTLLPERTPQTRQPAGGPNKSAVSIAGETFVTPSVLDGTDVLTITSDGSPAPAPAPTPTPTPGEGDNTGDEPTDSSQRGVLRLIAEGHFRGAAAARLRLNFFDELDHTSLPPLPEASGNGRGYAKALAEYQARLAESNPETPEIEPPPAEELPPTDGTPPADGALPPDGTEQPPLDGVDEPPVVGDGALPGAVAVLPNPLFTGRLSIFA